MEAVLKTQIEEKPSGEASRTLHSMVPLIVMMCGKTIVP